VTNLRDANTGETIRYDDSSSVGTGSTSSIHQSLTHQTELLKIYFSATQVDEERISEQLKRPCPHPSVSWPLRKLVTTAGQFAGYSMPKMAGTPAYYFINETLRLQMQLKWDHLSRFTVCIQTLEILHALARQKMLMQDLNSFNVLVVTDASQNVQNVNLIDVPDSTQFQVRNSMCKMINYTPPYFAEEMVPPEYIDEDVRKLGMTEEGLNYIAFCFVHQCLKGVTPFDYDCPSMELNERVKKGLYPFGTKKLPRDAVIYDTGIVWADFNPNLQRCCLLAASGKRSQRPSLERWIEVLDAARSSYQPAAPIHQPAPRQAPQRVPAGVGQPWVQPQQPINAVPTYSWKDRLKELLEGEPYRNLAIAIALIYITFLAANAEPEMQEQFNSAPMVSPSAPPSSLPSYSIPASTTNHFDRGSPEWRDALKGIDP
jgi:hypothetical protein